MPKFLFTYEFGMVLAHVPNDRWNIVHTLVVRNNDQRPVRGKNVCVGKPIGSAQKIGGAHEGPVKYANGPFYAFIAKYSVAKPNDRMKKQQGQTKGHEKDGRKQIG